MVNYSRIKVPKILKSSIPGPSRAFIKEGFKSPIVAAPKIKASVSGLNMSLRTPKPSFKVTNFKSPIKAAPKIKASVAGLNMNPKIPRLKAGIKAPKVKAMANSGKGAISRGFGKAGRVLGSGLTGLWVMDSLKKTLKYSGGAKPF